MTEIPRSGLKLRTASIFVWAAAGTGGQVLFQVLAIATLARLLTPAEFGVASAATIIAQFALILNEFGVGPVIVQRHSLNELEIRVGFTLSCCFGLMVVLGLWSSAPALAGMFQIPELTWVIRAYTIAFIMKSVSVVAESLLQRGLQFRLLARTEVISFALGYAGVGISAAACGLSYWSLVMAHLSQSTIKSLLILRYQEHPKRLLLKMDIIKEFLYFGVGQSVSRLGSYLASQGDSAVVAKLLGVERLGEYGRANQLVVMPGNQLGSVLDKVMFPILARVQNEKERFKAAYSKAIKIITVLALPVSLMLFVVAQDLTLVMLGDRWENVTEPMKILSLGIVFRLLHKISDPTARAAGAVYQRAWRQVVFAAMVVGGAYTGASYGLVGVAYGVLFAAILNAALMVHLCSRIAGLKVKDILLSCAPGIRLGAITYIVASCSQYFSGLIIHSHLGLLVTTVLLVFTIIGSSMYVIPKVSVGREGIDVVGDIWSVLNLGRGLRARTPTS